MKAKKEIIGQFTDEKNGIITTALMSVYYIQENGTDKVAIKDERRGLIFEIDYKHISETYRALKNYRKTL